MIGVACQRLLPDSSPRSNSLATALAKGRADWTEHGHDHSCDMPRWRGAGRRADDPVRAFERSVSGVHHPAPCRRPAGGGVRGGHRRWAGRRDRRHRRDAAHRRAAGVGLCGQEKQAQGAAQWQRGVDTQECGAWRRGLTRVGARDARELVQEKAKLLFRPG